MGRPSGAAARFDGVVGVHSAHQPDHTSDVLQPIVTRALRLGQPKGHVRTLHQTLLDARRRGQHGHHCGVVAVEHHQGIWAKYAGLGGGVMGQVGVPVQVVLADVEHGCGRGRKACGGAELETREFKHPDLGQGGRGNRLRQRVEQRGADIAGHGHGFARSAHQLTSKSGHGSFAVGAGHCQHGRLVGLVCL